ncbi:hypothetical protein [Paenibacillus lentus]
MALLATAGVPLRSDGKARNSASNSLHPLKQLAGLLLQGLIDQQIYEEERQAYYTKWILGKMTTSARQMLYSYSPIDLVHNVLRESNNMFQTYQQVPEDVRNRWAMPWHFPSGYVDTQRLTLEVQAELNWSDELTKDVAQRIVEKQDYNLIVKEMKRKYGVDVLGGVAIIYTCYNAERDGVTLNELFTGYTHNSSEVPYIRGGGFNVRVPNLNRKKPEFKTITQAELDKFVKSVKDRRPKNDPRNTTVDKPKETPEPPNPSNSTKGTAKIEGMPPIVQSRINISNDGFKHVVQEHFSTKNKSQFTISQDELRTILSDKNVVSTPVTRTLDSADGIRYVREVTLNKPIGTDKFNDFNPTSTMTILTDSHGNLVTASPGIIK